MSSKSLELSELYQNDPWVRGFMQEVYDMFGLPMSTDDCMSTSDRILHVWGMMTLVHEMKRNASWKSYKETMDPLEAALQYARDYHEETGRLLIESQTDISSGGMSENV